MLAVKAAPGMARTFIKARLHKWNYTHISDDACLITSEMVTNAGAPASPGGEIRFQVSRDGAGVLLAVWDSALTEPQARPVVELTPETLDLSEESRNGGRGLPIISALTVECGHCPAPSGGKWARGRFKP
ncbi:ATP-binding protein [Actinomadura formosensis]|uniref:ATP-binding protein n=1 Tax=Actinomadura formosensis TaxID=60706 RepID=UPI003D90E736